MNDLTPEQRKERHLKMEVMCQGLVVKYMDLKNYNEAENHLDLARWHADEAAQL